MNDLGKNLLTDLRSGKISDREFNMEDWINACGTVGCIAGHTLMREGQTALLYHGGRSVIVPVAASALDLPEQIAEHLFVPHLWVDALQNDLFTEHYSDIWTDNWRCDLDTIGRMKEWALSITPKSRIEEITGYASIYSRIGRLQAANALEQALSGEPYIDWQRAIA